MFSLFWTADDSVSIAKNPSVTAMLDLGESGSFAYLIIAGKKKTILRKSRNEPR